MMQALRYIDLDQSSKTEYDLVSKIFHSISTPDLPTSYPNLVHFIFLLHNLKPNIESEASFPGKDKYFGKIQKDTGLWVINKYDFPKVHKKMEGLIENRKHSES
jgi:hypothetical protein